MKLQDLVVEYINRSAAEVFSTMLGVELPAGEASIESGTPESNDGVVSLIGMAGAWVGTGSLSCSPTLACRICSLMLMAEFPAVNEDVLDAVAELTNMIIGGVKNDLERQVGTLGLSIPTVVFGKNFKTRSAGTTEWIVVRFPWEGEWLVTKLFLAPAEKAPHIPVHVAGSNCGLEV